MLTIRLARQGRSKKPFFRIVLTEHTKPVKAWFQEILGRFDPLTHKIEVQVEAVKAWIVKWSQVSERVAKLLYNETKDKVFSKFIVERVRTGVKRKEEKK